MFDVYDTDVARPLFCLVRILGQLEVAGVRENKVGLQQFLVRGEKLDDNRKFCIRFNDTTSLNITYLTMCPWQDRDRKFDDYYK